MRKSQIVCVGVAILLTVIILVGVVWVGILVRPIRRGTAAEFWYNACGVRISEVRSGWMRGEVEIGAERCVYELCYMNGSDLFFVATEDVRDTFGEMCKALEREVREGDPNCWNVKGYISWLNDGEVDHSSFEGLIERIDNAGIKWFHERSPDSQDGEAMNGFMMTWRLAQAKWYWANFVFEFLFLAGLVWFVMWAGIKGKGVVSLAWRVLLLPSLFMLPCWMGYGTHTVLNRQFARGSGIVYPEMLLCVPEVSANAFDMLIVERIPQLLEPLSCYSQIDLWVRQDYINTEGQIDMQSPTHSLMVGAGLAISLLVVVWVLRVTVRTWDKRREVVLGEMRE